MVAAGMFIALGIVIGLAVLGTCVAQGLQRIADAIRTRNLTLKLDGPFNIRLVSGDEPKS
jgi:threonine/homoserine/homoserine lactone efflux protein